MTTTAQLLVSRVGAQMTPITPIPRPLIGVVGVIYYPPARDTNNGARRGAIARHGRRPIRQTEQRTRRTFSLRAREEGRR